MENSTVCNTAIRLIYEAVGEEALWNNVLEHLRSSFEGTSVVFLRHNFETGRGAVLHAAPPDAHYAELYERSFCTQNPWLQRASLYQPGRVFDGEEVLPERDLLRTGFYQHYLQPQGIERRLCGVIARESHKICYLSVHRGLDLPPFEAKDRNLLAGLLPHFQKSLQLSWRLSHEHSESEALREVMDQFSIAIFIVSGDGEILFSNELAQSLIRREQGLSQHNGRLCADTPADQERLQNAIHCAATQSHGGLPQADHVVMDHGDEGAPLLLTVLAANARITNGIGMAEPTATIIAKDSHKPEHLDACGFGDLYKLTASEARLSSMILAGASLQSAAVTLGISQNTARSHMKHIYEKTGTHRQADLILLHSKTCSDHF